MEYTAKNIVTIRTPDGGIARLECHDSLPSTAALAKEYAKAGYPDRYVVFSEQLEYTKESANHKLTVHKKGGVYLSCILRPAIYTSQARLIPHMATVAFVKALEEHTANELGIGWIGDVFCGGKKVGGVTLEGKFNSDYGFEYIIVSFAVGLDKQIFPPRLTDMIRKVFESENNSISMIIAKNVLEKFFPLLEDIKNPTKFMDTYNSKFVQRNQKIKYNADGKRRSGRILNVDTADGSLIVEENKNIFHLCSVGGVYIKNRFRKKQVR